MPDWPIDVIEHHGYSISARAGVVPIGIEAVAMVAMKAAETA